MRDKGMERASEELERRSRYLSALIQQRKKKTEVDEKEEEVKQKHDCKEEEEEEGQKHQQQKKGKDANGEKDDLQEHRNVRVRASDMPPALQKRAFRCAWEALAAMPKLDSKRLALTLKKEFDSTYGPAWHCIVGTSFGSYVTHSLGGFLYFSIDKVYILLFRTIVEPLNQ